MIKRILPTLLTPAIDPLSEVQSCGIGFMTTVVKRPRQPDLQLRLYPALDPCGHIHPASPDADGGLAVSLMPRWQFGRMSLHLGATLGQSPPLLPDSPARQRWIKPRHQPIQSRRKCTEAINHHLGTPNNAASKLTVPDLLMAKSAAASVRRGFVVNVALMPAASTARVMG